MFAINDPENKWEWYEICKKNKVDSGESLKALTGYSALSLKALEGLYEWKLAKFRYARSQGQYAPQPFPDFLKTCLVPSDEMALTCPSCSHRLDCAAILATTSQSLSELLGD